MAECRQRGEIFLMFCVQICPKEFSRTTNLNKHMRVHSGQRPYTCGECPKMFRTRGDMLRHQIIHTGIKILPNSEIASYV